MAADLDDLCERTERLEDALTGPDGIRVQIARHLAQDEAHQQAAREAWGRIEAAQQQQAAAIAAQPKGWGARELTILGGIVGTIATIVGTLAGMGGSALPSAQASVHVVDQAQHAPAGPSPLPVEPQE